MSPSDSPGNPFWNAAPACVRARAWLVLALGLIPAVAAIWSVRWFATQDGPAHLYNAHILHASLGADSPFASVYTIRWQPLPNWGGHASLLVMLAVGVPPWAADKLLTTLTLIAVASGTLALRLRVAGDRGGAGAAAWAALVGLNVAWLFGFASFLLGVAVMTLTLGVWWKGRRNLSAPRVLALAALLVLLYFAHLVSLGLTAVALVVLTAAEPGSGGRRRWMGTAAALGVLVPLGWLYRLLARGEGAMRPLWMHLRDLGSIHHWKAQLGWVDPISLASKTTAPLVEPTHPALAVAAPVLWAAVALVLLAGPAMARIARNPREAWRSSPCRGWAVLTALFVLGGLLGPDALGENHGNYLAMRVLLVGLVLVATVLPMDAAGSPRVSRRAGLLALGVALALQSAFVWDYALRSDRLVGEMLAVAPEVGRRHRVGTLLLDLRQRFRANPRLHADNYLGVGTGNVIWSNYETEHYYFPVGIRPDVPHPPAALFERVSILDAPSGREERAALWADLLARYASRIDVLLVQGDDPGGLDPITDRYFAPVVKRGAYRVLSRRKVAAAR